MKTKSLCFIVDDMVGEELREFAVFADKKRFEDGLLPALRKDVESQVGIYKQTFKNVRQYSKEELDAHWKNKTQEWFDWADDLLILYALRSILFGQPIPIVAHSKQMERQMNKHYNTNGISLKRHKHYATMSKA